MENVLRMTLIVVWCMFFGFFSLLGYLDETLAQQRKAVILGGLLLILAAYLAFEWFTRSKEPDITKEGLVAEKGKENTVKKDPRSQLDERVLRRLHLYTKDNEQELKAAITPDAPKKRKKPAISTPKKV